MLALLRFCTARYAQATFCSPSKQMGLNLALSRSARAPPEAFQRRSGMRRLRMCFASHLREASVAVRSYYEGLPSMAGRERSNGGESRQRAKASARPEAWLPGTQNAAGGAPEGDMPRESVSQTQRGRHGRHWRIPKTGAFRRSAPSHFRGHGGVDPRIKRL